ncbi:MAG: squalene synthase HpnC [Ignavibacteria bacterium]
MSKLINTEVEKEYEASIQVAGSHYENFPVVSFLVPRRLRKHIAVVYRFARQADDIADEGIIPDEDRLAILSRYEEELTRALCGHASGSFWTALVKTIHEYRLTSDYFFDLLNAFKQDIQKKRYESFPELLGYCRNSANPVGRIILELFNIRDKDTMEYSDNVCTALQLTNFYQDISQDYEKGRVYIPLDEIKRFSVTDKDFELKRNNANFQMLLKFQIDRTYELFRNGRNILKILPFPLRNEIKCTILGGEKILSKIERTSYNTLNIRPKLSKTEYLSLLIKSLI